MKPSPNKFIYYKGLIRTDLVTSYKVEISLNKSNLEIEISAKNNLQDTSKLECQIILRKPDLLKRKLTNDEDKICCYIGISHLFLTLTYVYCGFKIELIQDPNIESNSFNNSDLSDIVLKIGSNFTSTPIINDFILKLEKEYQPKSTIILVNETSKDGESDKDNYDKINIFETPSPKNKRRRAFYLGRPVCLDFDKEDFDKKDLSFSLPDSIIEGNCNQKCDKTISLDQLTLEEDTIDNEKLFQKIEFKKGEELLSFCCEEDNLFSFIGKKNNFSKYINDKLIKDTIFKSNLETLNWREKIHSIFNKFESKIMMRKSTEDIIELYKSLYQLDKDIDSRMFTIECNKNTSNCMCQFSHNLFQRRKNPREYCFNRYDKSNIHHENVKNQIHTIYPEMNIYLFEKFIKKNIEPFELLNRINQINM